VLEAFVLHARSLIEFLWLTEDAHERGWRKQVTDHGKNIIGKKPHDNDVLAEHLASAIPALRVTARHVLSQTALLSGRQDLNLRPPGPQPEGPRSAQFWTLRLAGLSSSRFFSVSLNLFPELFPVALGAKARLTISTSCSEGA
jgi:hypothetical protein